MMKKNLLTLILVLAACPLFAAAPAVPAPTKEKDPVAGGSVPFDDPVFQDYVETSDGYLNTKNTPKLRGDFRDAPISAAPAAAARPVPAVKIPVAAAAAALKMPLAPLSHYKVTFSGDSGPLGSHVWPLDSKPGAYAREYVFLSIVPSGSAYRGLVAKLETGAGYRFTGEQTSHLNGKKSVKLLGWAPYSSLDRILRTAGVAGASVEKRTTGVPFKTKVTITLKVPYQNNPDAFVPEYIKTLSRRNEFVSEKWFRLPGASGVSKFIAFSVTGTLPVDMVGEVSRSPFVGSVEFNDSSL